MPDSALTLLDAVNAASFNKNKRMEYLLLHIDAKSLTGIDVSQDDDIFALHDWFISKKNSEKAATASLHVAQALFMQGNAKQATETYLKAFDFAQKTNNNRLKARIMGRLGDTYYDGGMFDEAMAAYLQALNISKTENDNNSQIKTLIKIGNCYLLLHQHNNAFETYKQAEIMAQSIENYELLISTLHNTGVALMATGNHKKAEEIFNAALAYPKLKDSAALFINLAKINFDNNRFDQAYIFGQRALNAVENKNELLPLPNIYRMMTLIEMQRKNISRAIVYMTTYDFFLHEIMEQRKKDAMIEVQQKYDFDKAQANYAIKQRNYIIVIMAVLIALCAFMIWARRAAIRMTQLMFQLDNLRQTEQQLLITQKQLQEKNTGENQKTINELRNRYEDMSKNLIAQHFELLTKIARECKSSETVDINRLKRLLFGNSEYDFWAASEKMIPKGLNEKIKNICPELDPNEMKICCLLFLNADATAISIALNIKEKSIYTYSSRIRTKLDMGSRTNIKKYIEEKLQEI